MTDITVLPIEQTAEGRAVTEEEVEAATMAMLRGTTVNLEELRIMVRAVRRALKAAAMVRNGR